MKDLIDDFNLDTLKIYSDYLDNISNETSIEDKLRNSIENANNENNNNQIMNKKGYKVDNINHKIINKISNIIDDSKKINDSINYYLRGFDSQFLKYKLILKL